MKLDSRQTVLALAGAMAAAGVFLAFRLYTLDGNLQASAAITRRLKADVERLEAENRAMKESAENGRAEAGKLAKELEGLRERDSASGKRNTQLEQLVGDAEKTLANQNVRIAELETKLKEAEDRLKRQREKSQGLAGAARDAKSGSSANADYAKVVESEWLSTIAQTEKMQKELEQAMLELADGNAAKSRMQREVATMHYNLAVILTGQGKFEAAVREYERVLQMRPDDADAHYNLGLLYDGELKDRPRALEHYRRYVELAPSGPDVNKVKLWIKEKEFETRLDHPAVFQKEENRF